MNSCGMFLLCRYLAIAVLWAVPIDEKIRATSSLSHQPPGLFHGFRRGVAIVKRYQVDLAAVDAARSLTILK